MIAADSEPGPHPRPPPPLFKQSSSFQTGHLSLSRPRLTLTCSTGSDLHSAQTPTLNLLITCSGLRQRCESSRLSAPPGPLSSSPNRLFSDLCVFWHEAVSPSLGFPEGGGEVCALPLTSSSWTGLDQHVEEKVSLSSVEMWNDCRNHKKKKNTVGEKEIW